ncbi:MAG: hypothetical protein V4651_14195 [Bacteroidota bacterium]
MRTAVLGLLVCVLFSCETSKQNTIQYIDTKALFKDVIERLSAEHKTLQKTLIFGDSSVTQNLSMVNWESELKPFIEIDLLKNAYKGRYKADTLQSENSIKVTYTPLDAKTDLNELVITLSKPGNSLQFLNASFVTNNTLYEATKELNYYADSLFTISGTQQVQLGNNVTYKITGIITEGQ